MCPMKFFYRIYFSSLRHLSGVNIWILRDHNRLKNERLHNQHQIIENTTIRNFFHENITEFHAKQHLQPTNFVHST